MNFLKRILGSGRIRIVIITILSAVILLVYFMPYGPFCHGNEAFFTIYFPEGYEFNLEKGIEVFAEAGYTIVREEASEFGAEKTVFPLFFHPVEVAMYMKNSPGRSYDGTHIRIFIGGGRETEGRIALNRVISLLHNELHLNVDSNLFLDRWGRSEFRYPVNCDL